jgi:hypothetical protein
VAEKNADLAYQTLDYIREHPEEYYQGLYFCGSKCCFAGWALVLNARNHGDVYLMDNDRAGREAMKVLGFTSDEANYTFDGSIPSFDVLERKVKQVLNGELEV